MHVGQDTTPPASPLNTGGTAAPLRRAWPAAGLGLVATAAWVAGTLVPMLILCGAAWLGLWLAHRLLVRRDKRLIALGVSTAASLALFEAVGGRIIEYKLGQHYNLDVDHRMKPDPARGINADGIRCDVEAADFTDDTFNIIFLGDSYVYGYAIDDARLGLVARIERLLNAGDPPPATRVRTINFAWTSSSPLLALRLLRDIGSKYRPDLVVHGVDMTDFTDDAVYRQKFRAHVPSPLSMVCGYTGVTSAWQWLLKTSGVGEWLPRGPVGILDWLRLSSYPMPPKRFFILDQPLEKSRRFLTGIESSLRDIGAHCRDMLKVPYVVILLPRPCQYSARESPRNWERGQYPVLGPYVLEPFRWRREFAATVDFPCLDILKDFQETTVFPTCFDGDPHWNAEGHAVAAAAFERCLRKLRCIPGRTEPRHSAP